MKSLNQLFILPLLALLFFSQAANSENVYKRLSAIKCDSLIKVNSSNPNFVILDVRTPGEWNNYHIMGSINRSTELSDFTAQLDALPKHKIFLMHCQSGGRSAGAFAKMKQLEFAEVYEMIGGLNSWNSSGLPTTTVAEPKLMLVNFVKVSNKFATSDTINISVTNRANDTLTFSSVSTNDIHSLANNFEMETKLEGAEDYTFSIFHTPALGENESVTINIESNGGQLQFDIVFKDGLIQTINTSELDEIVLYPNPAKNKIFIKNGSFYNIEEITIHNLNGQLVFKDLYFGDSFVNVSDLKNGIYFIQLRTKSNIISKKIIINQ